MIATVGSHQWLLQPVARKVASRRGRVKESRGAAATLHGHKLAMVSKTTFDYINFENVFTKTHLTFFGIRCIVYRVETLRSAM